MTPERSPDRAPRAAWGPLGVALAALPLVLLALLVAWIVRSGVPGLAERAGVPPLERVVFERVTLGPEGIVATVVNDGPAPVELAQVMVDEAYWAFEVRPRRTLSRLGRATLSIPYPWVLGEAHVVRVVTATGATFDHEIPVAAPAPRPDLRFFLSFALVGVYVGVLPVALGVLWFPLVARLGARRLDFVLAFTVGLLLFLLLDAVGEGVEAAQAVPDAYHGVALLVFAGLAAYLGLVLVGRWLRERRSGTANAGVSGQHLAWLVAVGIGLHNFGEGLAIGSAYALGSAALGALLIVGFTVHNTTEGVAIVAPLARGRPTLGTLAGLGLVGGAPTIAGAWVGGLAYAPVLGVVWLGAGAGAIAQVARQILDQLVGDRQPAVALADASVAGGLAAGVAIMYLTGLLVG